jgi:predicted O-methyltransferase YrrM
MWYRFISFLKFYWRAGTKYNVQSPMLHDFVICILDTSKNYYAYIRLEEERKLIRRDETMIEVQDFGAGSQINSQKTRSVQSISASAVSNTEKCKILFQLVNHYQCLNILELGTSLGISSAYMAWASLDGKIITLEGDPTIAQLARDLHAKIGLQNIDVVIGPFASTLNRVLSEGTKWDLVFIDGHHAELPTIQYFDCIKPLLNEGAIVIVDDIYWSKGMTNAWENLKSRPDIRLSVDLYHIGILFFNPALSKQDVTYIPYAFKPWRIGLFG